MRTRDLWYTGGRELENCVEIYRRMFKDIVRMLKTWDVSDKDIEKGRD